MLFWFFIVFTNLGLSVPAGIEARSMKRFFAAIVLSFVGIQLPLFVFIFSISLIPELTGIFQTPNWKGGYENGWLDCFHVGKLALAPLVLWASAAFYVVQISCLPPRRRTWAELGLFTGAVTSTLCLIYGLFFHLHQGKIAWWLLVPFYTSVWYSALSYRAIKQSKLGFLPYLYTFYSWVPFWSAGVIWSHRYYLSLPDEPPDCFVVTAAQRGHEAIVGPFTPIERHGKFRLVNAQLQTFWKFEQMWAAKSPRTHHAFRRGYNRLGPQIAKRIRSKLMADMVFLLLKPGELVAAIVIRKFGQHGD